MYIKLLYTKVTVPKNQKIKLGAMVRNNMVSSYENSTKESVSRKYIINFLTTVFLCSNYLMQADKLSYLI